MCAGRDNADRSSGSGWKVAGSGGDPTQRGQIPILYTNNPTTV